MAGTISNSLSLVKSSATVLVADKELLVFPLVSGLASILVMATFVAPAVLLGLFGTLAEGGLAAYAFGFLFYLAQYTVIFFFNTALVGAALIRLDGGDPTLGDGMRIAFDRFGTIVEYAALAATVGMVLRFIAERTGFVGRMVVGAMGIGWTLGTYLVVPVLVTRQLSPVEAVKESASLFRRTWGEQVVGSAGMGIAFVLMFVSYALFAVPALMLASSIGGGAVTAVVLALIVGVVLLVMCQAALKGIYSAALYRYATTGQAGYGFDDGLMGRAFATKG